MPDAENTTAAELAAQINGTQDAQVSTTDNVDISSANAEATREERLLAGKYKSVDELESSYLELQRNYTASRQAQRVDPVPQPTAQPETVFDTETTQGIRSILKAELHQELETRKATEFARKHREELADPLLRGAVLVEIQEANSRNEYIDQETALANAKAALEARLTPKVEAAVKESSAETKALDRKREQAGAVGGTSVASPTIDPDSLTAAEYAAYYGLENA